MRSNSLSKFLLILTLTLTFQKAFAVQMVTSLCFSIAKKDPAIASQILEFYNHDLHGATVGDFLYDAAHLGHTHFVELLLREEHLKTLESDDLDEAVLAAIANNRLEVVELLLNKEGAAESALYFAAAQGHAWAVRYLRQRLNNVVDRETVVEALQVATANGFTDVIEELMTIGTTEPIDLGFARLTAARYGFRDLVQYFDDAFRVRMTYMNLPRNVAALTAFLYAWNFGVFNSGGGYSK